ncbi:MAG: hypothetical protein WKF65_05975 [Gaiellaceae bacterium]
MIERLNGRAAVGLAAAGLLLVVLVGWLGFVSPQRSKAAELQVKIDEAETQLAVTQALIQGPLLRQSTAQLATLRLAIPDEVRMSGILRQLSEASARSRVRVLGITPQPVVVNAGGPDIVAMSVAIEGRYFGIREFLRLLRARAEIRADEVSAIGRLFAIDSIQFTGASAETGGGLIQATLSVTAFAFSDTVSTPVAGAPVASGDEPTAEAVRP